MDETIFKICSVHFKLIGFWPIEFESKVLALIYYVYKHVSFFIALMFTFLQFVELPNMAEKGMVKVVALGAVSAQFSLGVVKFLVLRGGRAQKLIKTIQVTERGILDGEDDGAKKIYLSYLHKVYILNKLFMSLGILCDCIFSVAPWLLEMRYKMLGEEFSEVVVDGFKERPLPLDSWVPFNKFKYYKTTYAWNIVGGVFNTLFICATDNTYFALIIFAICQMDMLRREMSNAIDASSKDDVDWNLKKAIIYHQNIIRYVKKLDQVMTGFSLLGVVIYIFQSALISFQIVMEPPSFEMAKNVYYLLAMIVEQVIFYWLGNEVYLGSIEIIDTFKKTKWYNCDTNCKKMLLFVLMRANKLLKLSVGPFFYMSTETMLMILKSSFSYSAALQTIYERKSQMELQAE